MIIAIIWGLFVGYQTSETIHHVPKKAPVVSKIAIKKTHNCKK